VVKWKERISFEDGKDTTRDVSQRGLIYKKQALYTSDFRGLVNRRHCSLQEALHDVQMIDLRFVGIAPFPRGFDSRGEFNILMSGLSRGTKIEPVSSGGVIVSRSTPVRSPSKKDVSEMSVYESWQFDTQTLTPVKLRREWRTLQDGTPLVVRKNSESITWEEKNNRYIPTLIDKLEDSVHKLDENARVKYEADNIVQLHWFSVNEPIAEDRFSNTAIETYDAAFKLVDPEFSGADTFK